MMGYTHILLVAKMVRIFSYSEITLMENNNKYIYSSVNLLFDFLLFLFI